VRWSKIRLKADSFSPMTMIKKTLLLTALLFRLFSLPAMAEDWADAVRNFKTAFTKCGDSYFVYLISGDTVPTQSDYVKNSQKNIVGDKLSKEQDDRSRKQNQEVWEDNLNNSLIELKGGSFTVKPTPRKTKATMADALNGLAEREGQVWEDWNVSLAVNYTAIRYRDYAGWREWVPENNRPLLFFISKNKNTIQYHKGIDGSGKEINKTTAFIAPTCDTIPKMPSKQCEIIAPKLPDLIIQRMQQEFEEYGNADTANLRHGLYREVLRKCVFETKYMDLQKVIDAYNNTQVPGLVPYQTWEPNWRYCERRRSIKEHDYESKLYSYKGPASRFIENNHSEYEQIQAEYKVCKERLRKTAEQSYNTKNILDDDLMDLM
jgi:hypothetical protein